MGLFKPCEGDSAIMVINGVYKPVQLATRDGYLYAAVSGGYVRLHADGSTSQPKMRLDHLDLTTEFHRDQLGRLCLAGTVKDSKPLEQKARQLLISN